MTRYVLEGEWTGYRSEQRKIVHREVITSEKRADLLRQLHSIVYTDNTSLLLHLRPARHREQIHEVLGYSSLIAQALREKPGQSRVLVADLSND